MARRFGITTPINTHPSMVLGTSDVRLLDMTRAFASVSRQGVAVVPYGITKVTTAAGDLLYEHEDDTNRGLVPPWVAAGLAVTIGRRGCRAGVLQAVVSPVVGLSLQTITAQRHYQRT